MADLAYQYIAAARCRGRRRDNGRAVAGPCRKHSALYDAGERILRDQVGPRLAAPLDDTGQTTITIG